MTELAKDQTAAYDAIQHWLAEPDAPQHFVLGGYAGTGKTFLMQHLVNNMDRPVICATPTGKAADVLKSKMPKSVKVSTIHHLLYSPVDSSLSAKIARLQYKIETAEGDTKKLQRILDKMIAKFEAEGDEDDVEFTKSAHEILMSKPLIIIDESSMVTMRMYNDFIETGCRLLFVGDPFQLPPVAGDNPSAEQQGVLDVLGTDAELTEIKRQALESPIIRIAHAIRHNENPNKHFDKTLANKVDRNRLRPEHYLRADQVICGTNKTRHQINRAARIELGHQHPHLSYELPVAGDKIICTMNKHKYTWINGVIHEAVSDAQMGEFGNHTIDVLYQDELREGIEIYDFNFRCNYHDPRELKDYKITDWREKMELIELDYAYGITCHKSQGSEWDKVLVVQDWFFGDKERWLYTAVTRAKEKLLWAA
jgi:exodeoxyribonuclease-5